MEMETSIGKAAARVALKSHNNLWRETKKEEKKAFCVCLDFISSEVNLIFQGDSKRVIDPHMDRTVRLPITRGLVE